MRHMDKTPSSSSDKNERDYADRDIAVGKILLFGFYTALFTGVALIGLRLLYKSYDTSANKADAALSSFVKDSRVLPPEPQLLVNEPANWAQELARQENLINHYEWVDKSAGTVKIPVARAIDLLAERGLPARETPPQ